MKKIVLNACCALAMSAMLFSCSGSGKSSSPEAEQQRSSLYEAMNAGDITRTEALADSLATNAADDLTTDESVAVLVAFLQVHNDAAAKKDSEKDLRTIRKFVDFYSIARDNHGDELNEAFNSAKELNSNLDLAQVVNDFSKQLADYDAGTADEDAPAAAPAKVAEKKEEPKKEEPKATEKKPEPKKEAPKPAEKPAAAQPSPEMMPVD